LIFLYFTFRGIDIRQVWFNIRQLDSLFIAASAALIVAEFILRAFRWKFLLNANSAPKVNQLFSVLMIGYFSNNIIPLRMGELVRAQLLGTNYNVNRARALATIVIERVCDMLTLLALFGVSVLLYDVFPAWMKQGGILTTILLLAISSLLYIYRHKAAGIIAQMRSRPSSNRLSKKLATGMENFGLGLGVLTDRKTVIIVLSLSVVIWAVVIVSIDMVLQSFSMQLSLFASIFVAVMVGLGMLLPAPPGNIGVYEGFAMLALVPFGIEREAALSFSLVLHFLELAITMSIGFVCLVREVGSVRAGTIKLWPSQAK
jgi:uncharacterized protein (TIRG00374 family)